ncbi:hypothetical protein [Onishia niordana]|nr:hypothetical protein [Halomonas niordiana]
MHHTRHADLPRHAVKSDDMETLLPDSLGPENIGKPSLVRS